MASPNTPLSPDVKKSLKIVFLTLFLDMVGFSIIFPLFPALVKHYGALEADNLFFKGILDAVQFFRHVGGNTPLPAGADIVLFGGALASLYSLLQFVCSPFWGALSDRVGRKPVLIFSIAGSTLSYLLWIFSGSFTLLIVSRLVSGVMSGNISTATAVIGDITTKANRAKGMAIVGIAFGIGFILGPALGGLFSQFDLTLDHPAWILYGVNPFSVPAFVAFALSAFNLFSVVRNFKESLPPEKRGLSENYRSANLLTLFKPLPHRGINLTNFANFLYTLAFAGMEFTLTFLAAERFAYSSMQNAMMFVFIGLIIAFVQGGIVRRHAHQFGEKKMTLTGLVILIPGLIFISRAYNAATLYIGLALLSIGSAMVIACLSALVSLYTPEDLQGKSIGIFRSLGALGRVLGPASACLLYWRFGSASPYYASAVFMVLPIVLVLLLRAPGEIDLPKDALKCPTS